MRLMGLEPTLFLEPEPKSGASAYSATTAFISVGDYLPPTCLPINLRPAYWLGHLLLLSIVLTGMYNSVFTCSVTSDHFHE